MNILQQFHKWAKGWERIDEVPTWIKFPVVKNSNVDFDFYAKGKNFKYKIEVKSWRTMSEEIRVYRQLR